MAVANIKFFIDECLSPQLARRLNDRNIDALHPLDVGGRGDPDHVVLRRCIEEDRIIVTENARDFRGLLGKQELHPGLIILPAIDREGTWALLEKVLARIERENDARSYMVNRVIEIDEAGTMQINQLPSARVTGRSQERD